MNEETRQYIVLQEPMPEWVYKKLMLYLRADGCIGMEFDTGKRLLKLYKGDVLISKGNFVKVIRGGTDGKKLE